MDARLGAARKEPERGANQCPLHDDGHVWLGRLHTAGSALDQDQSQLLKYNCTCTWVGLALLSQKLGYVPQHLSEHVDRGDQNISLIPVGFFGTLISSGIIASAIVSSLFTGHGHGGERPSTIVDVVPK